MKTYSYNQLRKLLNAKRLGSYAVPENTTWEGKPITLVNIRRGKLIYLYNHGMFQGAVWGDKEDITLEIDEPKKSVKVDLNAWQILSLERAIKDALETGTIEKFCGETLYNILKDAKHITVEMIRPITRT